MMKQLYYLKFLNCVQGPVFESFFRAFHNPGEFRIFGGQQLAYGSTRGKLDSIGLRGFSLQLIPDRVLILMLVWLYSIWASYTLHKLSSDMIFTGSKHTE